MLILKNQENVRKHQSKFNKEIFESMLNDAKIIEEEYYEISEQYGPFIVYLGEDELETFSSLYPLVKQIDYEDELLVSENEEEKVVRRLYLVNDNGYVLYIVKNKLPFRRNLYLTRGINEKLDSLIIRELWRKIHSVRGRVLDYLQIFKLRKSKSKSNHLEVVWEQEVPHHKEIFEIEGVDTEVDKVWVICTGMGTEEEYSTMLLPEEY